MVEPVGTDESRGGPADLTAPHDFFAGFVL
jgi:hypothetical protein